MKRYSSDQRTLSAVFVGLGGFSLMMVLPSLIPPIDEEYLVKGFLGISAGGIIYFIGTHLTYILLDKDTFICKSIFYRRTIPIEHITAFKELPNIPVPSFFVVYKKNGETQRANIVSTVFGWLTLGELAHDLKHANPHITLDAKATKLMREYEQSLMKEKS